MTTEEAIKSTLDKSLEQWLAERLAKSLPMDQWHYDELVKLTKG